MIQINAPTKTLALEYINTVSESPYARQLAIIHLLLSRLYADFALAVLHEVNLDPIMLDVIGVSILLTDFPSEDVLQKLGEISEKVNKI